MKLIIKFAAPVCSLTVKWAIVFKCCPKSAGLHNKEKINDTAVSGASPHKLRQAPLLWNGRRA